MQKVAAQRRSKYSEFLETNTRGWGAFVYMKYRFLWSSFGNHLQFLQLERLRHQRLVRYHCVLIRQCRVSHSCGYGDEHGTRRVASLQKIHAFNYMVMIRRTHRCCYVICGSISINLLTIFRRAVRGRCLLLIWILACKLVKEVDRLHVYNSLNTILESNTTIDIGVFRVSMYYDTVNFVHQITDDMNGAFSRGESVSSIFLRASEWNRCRWES